VSFTSVGYLGFLLVAVVLCTLTPLRAKPLSVLVSSCVFYALWDVRALVPLLGATLVTYYLGLLLDRVTNGPGRTFLACAGVILLMALLFLFKDLPKAARPFHWIVPLGISYYTFKLLSYLLDVFWGKQSAERDPTAFVSYAVFFPQIVAGPIQRSQDYLLQLKNYRPLSLGVVHDGLSRIALGLLKKLVIADSLGGGLSAVYGNVGEVVGVPNLAAFYLFPVQLFFDFSGLTDVAIGSALLLGIVSPENFARPFLATNISEYWRRWHMSLTNWTVDYVLTPVRMATRNWGIVGLVFSIWTNMMSVALWHGITWNFFVFGVAHSIFVSADAVTTKSRKTFFNAHPYWKSWARVFGPIFTFHLVAFGMVFWRATTIPGALWLLGHMWVPYGTLVSGFSVFLGSVRWRPFIFGLSAYLIFELIKESLRQSPEGLGFYLTQRWFRWGTRGVYYLLLFVGLLLMFVHGAAKQPFIYEIF
jgi:alginate O-acetyltransferase complex protein AlgI